MTGLCKTSILQVLVAHSPPPFPLLLVTSGNYNNFTHVDHRLCATVITDKVSCQEPRQQEVGGCLQIGSSQCLRLKSSPA